MLFLQTDENQNKIMKKAAKVEENEHINLKDSNIQLPLHSLMLFIFGDINSYDATSKFQNSECLVFALLLIANDPHITIG